MSNSILTVDMITRKALSVLENSLTLARNVNRQYDDSFAREGAKIGSTLRIRKPNRMLVKTGATLQAEDYEEQHTTLSITTQTHVDVNFTTAELTLSMDDFSDRFLRPAMSQLAAYIDSDVANTYSGLYHSVGSPGTTPATSLVLGQAMQKLDENAVERNPRFATVNPAANTALVEGMKGFFHPGPTISRQFRTGMIGEGVLGYDELNMSQSIRTHTNGAWGTTITSTGTISTQGTTSLPISFTGSSKTWKKGDVFTIADVYMVNPQTRESTGVLQQFVVTADTSGSSTATLSISPAIYTSAHKLATVNSFPQASAAITMVGTASVSYPQNLVYHRDAIALATADLVMPEGVAFASRQNYNGLSMRVVRQYDINNDRLPCRIDVLYGCGVISPERAVRLWG